MIIPVAPVQCSTCPFRSGSPTEHLRNYLEEQSFKTSRICHSTGGNRVIKGAKQTSRRQLICRGSRNLQLQFLTGMGFLTEPTDACWEQKLKEIERQKI